MQRFLIVFLLILVCQIAACNSYWYQGGKSFEECSKDRGACVSELKKYYDLDHIGEPETKFFENCMAQKGYGLLEEKDLPARVKRQDPNRSLYWFSNGIAGTVDE